MHAAEDRRPLLGRGLGIIGVSLPGTSISAHGSDRSTYCPRPPPHTKWSRAKQGRSGRQWPQVRAPVPSSSDRCTWSLTASHL
jgi:hypothetical protein